MEIVLVIIVVMVLLAGFGALFVLIQGQNRRIGELKNDTALNLIKQDLQGVTQTIHQTQQHMSERLDRAAAVFGGLQQELGKMQELGRSMKDIQDVLKSPKLRGNIGEQLMADLISQQIPKASYTLQHAFRSKETVDAVIKTKNGLIPIDAKFPAENYLKFAQAETDEDKERYRKLFISDVKKQVGDIARKYIVPTEGTVDFALMYVPGEAVYYDIMTNTDLCEWAAGVRVYMVSPHSFYYFLQTVLLSLEGEMIEAKAKEVMNYIKSIQVDSRKFGVELDLVNKHIGNAKTAMDKAGASYLRLGGKIESAGRLSGEHTAQIEATVRAGSALDAQESILE